MKRLALLALALGLAACETPSAPSLRQDRLQTPAAPSSATLFNFSYVLDSEVFNSCPAEEFVKIIGSLHYVGTGEGITPTSTDVKIHINMQNMQGIGLSSGDHYRVIQNDKEDVEFSFPPLVAETTFDSRFRLIRQGSNQNLWLRVTGIVTPEEFKITREEIECRG